MDDAELVGRLRQELRGEVPPGSVYAEYRLAIAALAAEVRALHEDVRQLRAAMSTATIPNRQD